MPEPLPGQPARRMPWTSGSGPVPSHASGASTFDGLYRATCPLGCAARIVYTSAVSPVDGGDFNLSLVTAARMGQPAARVRRNRADLRAILGRPVVQLHQVHSNVVVDLDGCEDLGTLARKDADAMVTTRRGLVLAILTGDCTPVLFVDSAHGVFAGAHAGRRGVMNGVAVNTVRAMVSKGAVVSDIDAWIGPNICGRCYETGPAIAGEFEARFPGCSTITRFGGPGIDMRAALVRQLTGCGLDRGRIHDSDPAVSPLCTLENQRLYSYREWTLTRRPDSDGRFLSLVIPRTA